MMYKCFFKRILDIVLSLIGIIVLAVPMLIIAIVIKIDSPGPVFFLQKRIGIDKTYFNIIKFRSMPVTAPHDTPTHMMKNTEDILTPFQKMIRRLSIDELPQFINVLLGDMSIVGPRPHMLKHTEEYSKIINKYMVRHFIKPGITGWAQVTGFRGETRELEDMEGRVKADIWYMEHWSFLLDLYIMYKTVANVLHKDKQAY